MDASTVCDMMMAIPEFANLADSLHQDGVYLLKGAPSIRLVRKRSSQIFETHFPYGSSYLNSRLLSTETPLTIQTMKFFGPQNMYPNNPKP